MWRLPYGTWEPVVRFKGDPTAPDGTVPGGVHHRYRMIRKTDKLRADRDFAAKISSRWRCL